MRGLPPHLKKLVTRQATPQARQLVLSLFHEQKRPLTIQELYNLASQRQEQLQTEGSGPILPSMRYLKKVVLPELAGADKIQKVHAKVQLSKEELEELKDRMGRWSKKSASLPQNVELWRWQLKTQETAPPAPKKEDVFGKEVGVGADWLHLNRRRQQAREEKVKKDVEWLKELDRARKEAVSS